MGHPARQQPSQGCGGSAAGSSTPLQGERLRTGGLGTGRNSAADARRVCAGRGPKETGSFWPQCPLQQLHCGSWTLRVCCKVTSREGPVQPARSRYRAHLPSSWPPALPALPQAAPSYWSDQCHFRKAQLQQEPKQHWQLPPQLPPPPPAGSLPSRPEAQPGPSPPQRAGAGQKRHLAGSRGREAPHKGLTQGSRAPPAQSKGLRDSGPTCDPRPPPAWSPWPQLPLVQAPPSSTLQPDDLQPLQLPLGPGTGLHCSGLSTAPPAPSASPSTRDNHSPPPVYPL